MSQPSPHNTPTAGGLEIPLEVKGVVVPGPDGQPMAALIFDYKISAHQIVMSAEAADILADQIGPVIREAAAQARRARSGLIVPTGPVQLPPMPNGRPVHG